VTGSPHLNRLERCIPVFEAEVLRLENTIAGAKRNMRERGKGYKYLPHHIQECIHRKRILEDVVAKMHREAKLIRADLGGRTLT
jgi:hypothetical protein